MVAPRNHSIAAGAWGNSAQSSGSWLMISAASWKSRIALSRRNESTAAAESTSPGIVIFKPDATRKFAEVIVEIVDQLRGASGVEQYQTPGMLDQVAWHRHRIGIQRPAMHHGRGV